MAMGDRANIWIKKNENDSGVWLYTHWSGSELPSILQTALTNRWRWKDSPYLTRIIFCEMVKGQEREETGFGISSECTDGDDRILIVNVQEQTVTVDSRKWTFEKFIWLPDVNNIWN